MFLCLFFWRSKVTPLHVAAATAALEGCDVWKAWQTLDLTRKDVSGDSNVHMESYATFHTGWTDHRWRLQGLVTILQLVTAGDTGIKIACSRRSRLNDCSWTAAGQGCTDSGQKWL